MKNAPGVALMKIQTIRTIVGPNTFHRNAVLLMTLDLEDRADTSSDALPGFNERLVALVPGLREHRCSPGYVGGFVERLERGTYFAHIIEHVALELSGPAGIEVGFGKTVYAGAPGIYQIAVRYRAENAMKYLLESAVALVEACARATPFDISATTLRAREIAEGERLGPSTQAIVDAAIRRGIPWRRVNTDSLIEFGYGSRRKRIQATITGVSSHIAVEIAQNKDLTKAVLARMGLPVPRGTVVDHADAAVEALEGFGGAGTVSRSALRAEIGILRGKFCSRPESRTWIRFSKTCPSSDVAALFVTARSATVTR